MLWMLRAVLDVLVVAPHPDDAELDMLELAHGETDTSRLGCQIKLSESLNGLKITIPDGVHNLMDDIPFPD